MERALEEPVACGSLVEEVVVDKLANEASTGCILDPGK